MPVHKIEENILSILFFKKAGTIVINCDEGSNKSVVSATIKTLKRRSSNDRCSIQDPEEPKRLRKLLSDENQLESKCPPDEIS